jgi:hypothetical protein
MLWRRETGLASAGRVGEAHNRSGRCRECKNLLFLLGIEPRFLGHPACSIIVIFTELHILAPELGWIIWYSVWLWGGRPRGLSSSAGGGKNCNFSMSSALALGLTQRPIQWVPRLKRLGREAEHSNPTSAEVKKTWIYKFTPPYVFVA